MSKNIVNGSENGVLSPPEPKRIKIEGSSGTESTRGKSLSVTSPPLQRNRTDMQDVISPNVDMHASGSPVLSAKIIASKKTPHQELNYPHINDNSNNVREVTNDMRCTSCDIGFSQMSNYLAHKKYYCRGLLSSSPTQLDVKTSPSGECIKIRNVILSPEKDEEDN